MNATAPLPGHFSVTMPDWFGDRSATVPSEVRGLDGCMAVVNAIARKNFEGGTGGPFAAGVFDADSGKVIALGVNRVMPSRLTSAHAEVTTVSLAQIAVGHWDLGAEGDNRSPTGGQLASLHHVHGSDHLVGGARAGGGR